ncbi:MAG TPA: hypothetical protein ENI15_00455 [Spirochaetes bacterium]|nr:hypothetical protein [Spirochaetota bacterium]
MKFKLEFNMDNAAFEDADIMYSVIAFIEVEGILNKVADDYQSGDIAGAIRDSNGNAVGKWEIEGD